MSKIVEMHTSAGTMRIELDDERAPQTVRNFLDYVGQGHYDGTIFHRVIKGFMLQGGGFDADMRQKPTAAPIANEANNGLKNKRYTLAMARTSAPHSATSQFFINTVDNGFLDFTAESAQGWGYAVFGRVVEGTEVADAIEKVRTDVPNSLRRLLDRCMAKSPAQRFQTGAELADALILTSQVASQIVKEPGGEPLACALKALGMPGESYQRVLLFLNPSLGASVMDVYRLARLYEVIDLRTALIMLAAWRGSALAVTRAKYRPALYDDERQRARSTPSQSRPAVQPGIQLPVRDRSRG